MLDWPDFFFYRFRTFPLSLFVLCLVFKCQFFELFKKNHFRPFMYIFQRAVTQSKIVRLTRFFSTGSEHSNYFLFVLECYRLRQYFWSYSSKTHFRCSSQICEDIFITCPISALLVWAISIDLLVYTTKFLTAELVPTYWTYLFTTSG